MEEAEGKSQWNGEGRVEEELPEADAEVSCAEVKVEADAAELADREESVEAGVKEGELAEDGEAMRPRWFEPAEIDGEAEGNEDEEVQQVCVLFGIKLRGEP
jgi:hypothetical protein